MSPITIEAVQKDDCTGCMLCGDVCIHKAITFYTDQEGFWFPKIDQELCAKCGLCAEMCPSLHDLVNQNIAPIKCYGAQSKDEKIRSVSTSGGVFSELAMVWMNEGGLCCGAEYDENLEVVHSLKKDIADIAQLRKSKYVQSNTATIYDTVKKALKANRKVLFCGTPCQVAAVNQYLSGDAKSLLTMDFVCCGICSPQVYRKYLDMLEQHYRSKVRRIQFKSKEKGWRSISTEVEFANGKRYLRTGNRDPYMTSFITDGLSMRKCCQICKYRKIPHSSDITIADFWGIEKVKPSLDDNRGTSAVIINTEKGSLWFDQIKNKLSFFETEIVDIARGNFTIYKPTRLNPNREKFLDCVIQQSFKKAVKMYSSYSGMRRLRIDALYHIAEIKRTLKRIWEGK